MRLPHLLATQFSRLQRPYGDSEIRTAMFSIDNSRSPGPNEYSSAFLKQNWETVGDMVCQVVRSFLTTGYLLKEWNYSILIMIPKQDIPKEIGHLRPISLCITMYKCATKCIALRMKSILPSIMSISQHAFIEARYMTDNILFSHELIEKINHGKCGR